jgi:hypothetical protein
VVWFEGLAHPGAGFEAGGFVWEEKLGKWGFENFGAGGLADAEFEIGKMSFGWYSFEEAPFGCGFEELFGGCGGFGKEPFGAEEESLHRLVDSAKAFDADL